MTVEIGDIECMFSKNMAALDELVDLEYYRKDKLYTIRRSLAYDIQDAIESQYMNVYDELVLHKRRTVIG